MNIYLATKFTNQEAFHDMRKKLEARGHTIALDWTKEDASKVPEEERPAYLTKCATADFRAVKECDCFILLVTNDMAGAHTELGVALGEYGLPILILGADKGNQKNIFYHMEESFSFRNVATEEELFNALAEINGVHKLGIQMAESLSFIGTALGTMQEFDAPKTPQDPERN